MVERNQTLDQVFSALSDSTRRALLERLRRGSATVSELADPFPISLNAISKHVRVLEGAGLVRREVRGREHRMHLRGRPLRAATRWTERYREFWDGRLDALEQHLRDRKSR